MVVVDGGASSSFPVDIQAEKLVTLHVDLDEHLDVLLSSSAPNHTSVLLGDGLGLDDGLALILAMASGTSLIEVHDAGFGCRADLDGPPASTRVIVGNFTDNEGEEFATLVWSRCGDARRSQPTAYGAR